MVLAAESRTTFTEDETGRHRIGSDFSQKIFPICDSVGVATYGDAFIANRTIGGLMDEFVSALPGDTPRDANSLATVLGEFFDERFRAANTDEHVEWYEENDVYPLGFLVAGYDEDGIGRIREVALPGPEVQDDTEITTASLGVLWRGQTDVIRRLIKGIDSTLLVNLGHQIPELAEPIEQLEYRLLLPITMQDAVDFASFLIRTTIDMQRFSDGTMGDPGDVPGCGGPIRVLAITREASTWVAEVPLAGPSEPGVAEGGAAA
jgi:hypothetical protein